MSFLLHSCLFIGECLMDFLAFLGKAALSIARHLAVALWYLIKWSALALVNLLYYGARLITLPFRMCFPKEDIDQMDGIDFEQFAASWLKHNGFQKVHTTPISGDYGVDLTAVKDGVSYGIQCKRYSEPVGLAAVQEVSAGIAYYGLEKGMVFTNSELTKAALNLAEANGIEVLDGEYLKSTKACDLITRTRASLKFSVVSMQILFLLSISLDVFVLLLQKEFVLLPLMLTFLCLICLANAKKELRRRDAEAAAPSFDFDEVYAEDGSEDGGSSSKHSSYEEEDDFDNLPF